MRLYDPRRFSPLGFVLTPFPVERMPACANDDNEGFTDPPPIRPEPTPPPTVRPLDDLSVRRAEREFLRS